MGGEPIIPHLYMELDEQLEQMLEEIPLNKRPDIAKGGMNDFLSIVVEKFYEKQINNFPLMCNETRRINKITDDFHNKTGYKSPTRMVGGRVTEGSSGWSENGEFKHKWVIPSDLRNFMRNCIYVNFWDDENQKVRDSFMKAILRGDDSYSLLKKVRNYYGTNNSKLIETVNQGQANISS